MFDRPDPPYQPGSDPLPYLWAQAAKTWDTLCLGLDSPADMAACLGYGRRTYRVAQDLLYHLEWLVRRIVFLAAAALSLPARPPRQPGPRVFHGRVGVRIASFRWPSTWQVSFCMLPGRSAHGRRPAAAPSRPPPVLRSTWPLARRFEALRRVIAEPEPTIRRFARTMARLRARGARGNAPPREIRFPGVDFSPGAMTIGKHSVAQAMDVADDALDRLIRPG